MRLISWTCLSLLVLTLCAAAPAQSRRRPVKRVVGVPPESEIVYLENGFINVMNRDGTNVLRVVSTSRNYEHAAVSPDRRFVVANEQLPNPSGDPGGRSRLWLFDLADGTERQLLPGFLTAGNGGVAFGPDGFLYFAAKERDLFPQPRSGEEFIANAAANDVYKVRVDGTGLQRLTQTTDRGEADVSVSADGQLVSFQCLVIQPPNDFTEIRVVSSDGTRLRTVFVGGAPKVSSVHDPELSPDNTRIVFSQVNPNVPPNFPENPEANTAHDLISVKLDGSDRRRLTAPGPISIIPDWKGDTIVYLELNDADDYLGVSMVSATHRPDRHPHQARSGNRPLDSVTLSVLFRRVAGVSGTVDIQSSSKLILLGKFASKRRRVTGWREETADLAASWRHAR